LAWEQREAFDQGFRLAAAVRLDEAGRDVAAALHFAARCREHGIGLADAGRGAEKYLQMPAPLLFRQGEKGVGRRAGRFNAGHAVSSCGSYTKKTRGRFASAAGGGESRVDQDLMASSAR